MNGTICGLYTRVSSRNRADADYSSLETQRERLEAYLPESRELHYLSRLRRWGILCRLLGPSGTQRNLNRYFAVTHSRAPIGNIAQRD